MAYRSYTRNALCILALVAVLKYSLAFELVILHTNDFHDRFEQTSKYSTSCSATGAEDDKCYGGVARLYTKVTELRQRYSNTLLLDAGDQFQGTLWFHHYGGNASAIFMERLGYDAMAIGNHEFDDGISGLVSFLEESNVPVLSSNIDASNVPRLQGRYQPCIQVPVGGQSVGIVGCTTQKTPILTKPDNVKDVIFKDEITSVRAEVKKLQDQGVNKIIALCHAGFEMDKLMAAEVDGVDVVVGGHTNTFLYNGDPPSIETPVGEYPYVVTHPSGDVTLAVSAYAYGKYLGFLNVTFDDNGRIISYNGNPILLNGSIAQDPGVLAEINVMARPLEVIKNTVVGETRVFLDGGDQCRREECNLGNLVTDAIVWRLSRTPNATYWTDTAIAIWNGGGIRTSLTKGKVTWENVLSALPFRNVIQRITLKGKDLLAVLEHSGSRMTPNERLGRFLQLSGIKVVYDITRPVGQRVVEATVRCHQCEVPEFEPLDPSRDYPIMTSYFVISGGDGYSMFEEKGFDYEEIDLPFVDAVIDYIKSVSPVVQGTEGRIKFMTKPIQPPPVICGTDGHVYSAIIVWMCILWVQAMVF